VNGSEQIVGVERFLEKIECPLFHGRDCERNIAMYDSGALQSWSGRKKSRPWRPLSGVSRSLLTARLIEKTKLKYERFKNSKKPLCCMAFLRVAKFS